MITVETKTGLDIELAIHLSAVSAQQAIQRGAAQAVNSLQNISPLAVAPPYELEIRVREGCPIATYLEYDMERIDERTVVKRSRDLIALFQ